MQAIKKRNTKTTAKEILQSPKIGSWTEFSQSIENNNSQIQCNEINLYSVEMTPLRWTQFCDSLISRVLNLEKLDLGW